MQLADPLTYAQPTFDQALADFATARFLRDNRIDAAPYNGNPAFDAAVAKLQQCAEKALKATILVLAPGESGLVFSPHDLFSDRGGLPSDRRFQDVIERIGRDFGGQSLRAILTELQGCAPAGVRKAVFDSDGNVVALPLNTEYPSRDEGEMPVAPVYAWRSRERDVARYERAVTNLLRHLKGIGRVSSYLADYSGRAIER